MGPVALLRSGTLVWSLPEDTSKPTCNTRIYITGHLSCLARSYFVQSSRRFPNMYLADFSSSEVSAVCCILQLRPEDDGLTFSSRVLSLIKKLPPDLQRPNKISRLVLPAQNSYTNLCALHKPFDASLVHAIFQLLALEAGVRLNVLVSNSHILSRNQWVRINDIRKLHAIWLAPATYLATFMEVPDPRWPYQQDGCEACMLSRVGGSLDILLAFRTVLLSKTHRDPNTARNGPPSLLRWVEAWIASITVRGMKLEPETFERMMSENDSLSVALKDVRKSITRAKRLQRPVSSSGRSSTYQTSTFSTLRFSTDIHAPNEPATQSDGQHKDTGPTDYDAEMSIVNHYAALLSTPHLPETQFTRFMACSIAPKSTSTPQTVPNQGQIRLPVIFTTASETSEPNRRQCVSPTSIYTTPLTSTDTLPLDFKPPAPHQPPVYGEDKFADTYRNLLSPPPTKPTPATSNPRESSWTDVTMPRDSYANLVSQSRGGLGISRPTAAVLPPKPQDPRQAAASRYSRYTITPYHIDANPDPTPPPSRQSAGLLTSAAAVPSSRTSSRSPVRLSRPSSASPSTVQTSTLTGAASSTTVTPYSSATTATTRETLATQDTTWSRIYHAASGGKSGR